MTAGELDEKVRTLVEVRRPELEQLVDKAIEREIAVVAERLEARNGIRRKR